MTGEARSLLTFLPTPVAVGDPDGRAVYVNPAFERRFDVRPGDVRGRPLAELFVGGGREAVLRATARVCGDGREFRFRLRERERGYAVVAAPILAEGQAVGILFLFWDEAVGEERLLAFQREIAQPVEDLAQCLDSLLEQTGGRRAERFRQLVEEGLRAVERIRKWTAELAAVAAYGDAEARPRGFDAVALVRHVAESLAGAARAAGHGFELLAPPYLPPVRGDGDRLELALSRFVRERVRSAQRGTAFTLAAKQLGDGCVGISFVETPPASFSPDDDAAPAELETVVEALGGELARVADPVAGITTALRLPVV